MLHRTLPSSPWTWHFAVWSWASRHQHRDPGPSLRTRRETREPPPHAVTGRDADAGILLLLRLSSRPSCLARYGRIGLSVVIGPPVGQPNFLQQSRNSAVSQGHSWQLHCAFLHSALISASAVPCAALYSIFAMVAMRAAVSS
jgi:hypothetical protein